MRFSLASMFYSSGTITDSIFAERKHDPKPLRRDWEAMRASLVFDDRGVGHTPDGEWLYYPGPPTKEVLPAGHAAERVKWMSLGFVEEGENAREMLPSTSDEESEGEGEKDRDVEMGGMGGGARPNEEGEGGEGGEGGKGGGDVLAGVEGAVAELELSGVAVQ
jgi:hypothetical protein